MLKNCGTCFVLTALVVVAFMNGLCLAGEDVFKAVHGQPTRTGWREGTGVFLPKPRPRTGVSSGSRGTSQRQYETASSRNTHYGNIGSQSYGTGPFHPQNGHQGAKAPSHGAENDKNDVNKLPDDLYTDPV
ncbi:hypothetical protein PGT21_010001 [Puccinia graminis f. sp. tritici]|uniref:Secreted protein n=1 Tax=Puccinia graminis f. sp. tritici TaxID=56615 RepID=A0A5B0RXD8_PUCGR|nr:hypothetical protein PGT21_010001 [Puccinia graminis f. sp. tritici]KAA1090028.1 hypothetical protein PGTUg99_034227 [Puccinia graminis f. sp. tritici]KAA1129174.1 hypothetical protein PGTUg99_002049 [Puccinia graminis f. sp. tritici]